MASSYFTQAELEERLSAKIVREIYDDDNSGAADGGPIARLIADASSKVDSYLRGIYTLPLSTVPNEVKRLALDVAEAYAAKRFPAIVRKDWKSLMECVEGDLLKLRKGITRLDVQGAPEPAANHGAEVRSGNPTSPNPCPPRLWQDMGDFSR